MQCRRVETKSGDLSRLRWWNFRAISQGSVVLLESGKGDRIVRRWEQIDMLNVIGAVMAVDSRRIHSGLEIMLLRLVLVPRARVLRILALDVVQAVVKVELRTTDGNARLHGHHRLWRVRDVDWDFGCWGAMRRTVWRLAVRGKAPIVPKVHFGVGL